LQKPVRRRLLIAAATAGAAGITGALLWQRRSRDEHARHVELPLVRDPDFPNPLQLPGTEGMYGVIDLPASLTMIAKPVRHALLPGKPAAMLAYEVEHQGRTFLNPVLRARTGTAVRAKFWNALEDMSIIHWHGFKVDSNNDGHPHYAVAGGATYDYQYVIANRAALYWYHPHPHRLTGKQVYLGLAGLYLIEDDEELELQRALDLRFGVTDVPLVLQDKRLDEAGNPVFAPTSAERFAGLVGSQVLVNLTPRPHFHAATRIHRFRILNASNARIYRLAFRHGARLVDYTVIGGDGGLLDRPRAVQEAFLAPAERLDILLDLRDTARGDVVSLVSLPFDPMHREAESTRGESAVHGEHAAHGGHGEATAHGGEVPDGAEIELMRIVVNRRVAYDRRVPSSLSRIEPLRPDGSPPRPITLDQKNGIWRINGRTYVGHETPIVVKRGAIETWAIRNVPRSMPHPVHIHGFQFQLLDRSESPEQQLRLAVTQTGLAATDLGWKDTVLVWPGETVRIVTDFSHPFLGDQVYMVHCHNLEHEDGGMMLNLKVTA
jgi:suppressor of ftsI/bilirubin oxidase